MDEATYRGGGDEVGVPGTVGNLHVVDAILLLALLAKDVAVNWAKDTRLADIERSTTYRYLDALTKRDILTQSTRSPGTVLGGACHRAAQLREVCRMSRCGCRGGEEDRRVRAL